jgi:hypothetical protein
VTAAKPADWVILRRRVSLAGRVTLADGSNADGGVVRVASAQAVKKRSVTGASAESPGQYETTISRDGFYFFLDLPSGDYLLSGRDEHGSDIEAKPVSIPPAKGAERAPVIGVDLVVAAVQARVATGRQSRKRGSIQPGLDAGPRAADR